MTVTSSRTLANRAMEPTAGMRLTGAGVANQPRLIAAVICHVRQVRASAVKRGKAEGVSEQEYAPLREPRDVSPCPTCIRSAGVYLQFKA